MDMGLKEIAEEGFVRFSIKAKDTEENVSVHEAFKQFCAVECDNNYTQGLRKLLENYEDDFRVEMLWEAIHDMSARLDELEAKIRGPQKPAEEGAF